MGGDGVNWRDSGLSPGLSRPGLSAALGSTAAAAAGRRMSTSMPDFVLSPACRMHATDPNHRPGWLQSVELQPFHHSAQYRRIRLTAQAAYAGQHPDHWPRTRTWARICSNPNGTSYAGPYLAGKSVPQERRYLASSASTCRRRSRTITLCNSSRRQPVNKELTLQLQLRLVEGPDQQPGLLRTIRQCRDCADYGHVAFQSYVYNVRLDHGLCDADVDPFRSTAT